MDVHQFATSLTYGDAISDEMIEIRKVLQAEGHASEIFVRFIDPKMAGIAHDYREYARLSSPRNVVIFHFSIGSPVSKLFSRIPDRKIMIYHNITPYEFFLDFHRILTRECYKGRLEMRLFAGKVDLALGDSEFNRQELERAGFAPTGVLPILADLGKFDVPGDPVVRDIYDNGKTTLLFVGRVIPNKRFEDVIRTFYFYKTRFNPNSQLLLAGDDRGIERYRASLEDLVGRLALPDVHITGHVDFDELVTYYRLARCYLSFSAHEGFGVPLLEAFHMKVPVVALAAGAVEETMNGGGVLLRERDLLRTAALIDRLEKDAGLRRKIVEGQLQALAKYDRAKVSRILLDHVAKVAGQ